MDNITIYGIIKSPNIQWEGFYMSEKELYAIFDEIRSKGKTTYSIDGEIKSYDQIISDFNSASTTHTKSNHSAPKKSFLKRIFA